MARNEEKHYGKLNRLYLQKEKEEYEKANPKRPRLDLLYTPEEIQKWIPSIKRDIEFYLKKSQVTCYSDTHIEDCQGKIIKLEKEFKAFVRKMKQLSPAPLEAIPWTNRPYKRKKSNYSPSEENSSKQFKHIATPILDKEDDSSNKNNLFLKADCSAMDQPLNFSPLPTNDKKTEVEEMRSDISDLHDNANVNFNQNSNLIYPIGKCGMDNESKQSLVNYESSDSENS